MALTRRAPGETFAGHTELEVKVCPNCGVMYAAPERLFEVKFETGESWYCPNGHSVVFTNPKPKVDEAKRLEERLRWAREDAARQRAARDQAEADARAQKAAKTRFKNQRDRERTRTAAGVCPCCNRTFKQLARHVQSQHPEYAAGETA